MHKILDLIVQSKKQEVDRLRANCAGPQPLSGNRSVRDFKRAVSRRGVTSLIAEIKFASPSAGILRAHEDPARLAGLLEEAGAAALSVVTESNFFKGDPNDLPMVANAVTVPVLLKDFILDELQVLRAYELCADAVLLIARILPGDRLTCLIDLCKVLGMTALVEVHDSAELDSAVAAGAEVIGVNNRDLDSFRVDLAIVRRLAPTVPESVILVSESGIQSAEDVMRLRRFGVHAVLAGTVLMKAPDPAVAADRLIQAGRK